MMLGAPHLPNSMWGLADLNAVNVHDVLPQIERGNMSPYQATYKYLTAEIIIVYTPLLGGKHDFSTPMILKN